MAEHKMDELCTPYEDPACPAPRPGDKGDLGATFGGFDIVDGEKDSYPHEMPYVTTINLEHGAKRGESFESAIDTFKGTIKTERP